mgnify:CR=1 FL=1
MKFAVIATGGKQYLVKPGETLLIEKLPGSEEMQAGDKISFDQVLLAGDESDTKIGMPTLSPLQVHATLVENGRHKKVIVLKYKAKSRYKKRNGHRQPFTKVKIESIA